MTTVSLCAGKKPSLDSGEAADLERKFWPASCATPVRTLFYPDDAPNIGLRQRGKSVGLNRNDMTRRSLLQGAAIIGTGLGARAASAAPRQGGSLVVATIGEPPTLDPMDSPADITGMIGQHIFETLYTWGDGWNIVPLLAAAAPEIAPDGRSIAIRLRQGVRFHDGSTMTAADVLASLQRWVTVAQRGRQVAARIDSITAPDPQSIRITLKEPYAPLLSFLALQTSAAIIRPRAAQAMVGTGPYRFRDRQPDQYVRLERFPDYVARDDAPSLYGGRRTPYLDELRFEPVPNATTRLDGVLAGQYGYADSLPVETLVRFKGQAQAEPVILRPFGWPFLFINCRKGSLTTPALRRAVMASLKFDDMLAAAFGSTEFYGAEGAWYPQGTAMHSDAGADLYAAAGDSVRAAKLARDGGYKGQTIRFMVSMQYDFHYKIAQVAQALMQAAGFKVDLVVLDWATLLQRRNDSAAWDIFITHGPILPEPTLFSFMDSGAPGWWASPARDQAVARFNGETDPARRARLWADVQQLIYTEVPVIRVGNFNALAARSHQLQGFSPAVWPFFWNTSLDA